MPARYKIDTLAKSLLGNNCKKVDITANGVLNVGDDDLGVPNMNTYSMNSTTNSSTLFSMEVDAIGNMTKFNGYDFNWNGRRLESISQDGVELISYKYNIDGQRVSKTVGNTTTEYFYNGDILAGQKTGNDVLIFMYDNNGDVFGFTYNGTPYYYIKNAQNDVYMIVDETGVAYVLYMYDAWGRVACYDGTDFGLATINPLMYRSYYIDVETGYFFYYLNSRYYLADLGRFISADSYVQTGQGMLDKNMFAYCANNPVTNSDPSGHFVVSAILSKVVIGAVTGAILGAASNTLSQLMSNGWNWKELNYKEIGRSALVGGITGAVSGGFSTAIGLAKGASAVAQCAAKIFTNGVISAGGYTLDTMLAGEEPTYSGQLTAFATGTFTTALSIKLSSITNNSLFKNYTKSQKHSALGGTVSHRNIRNGSYIHEDAYVNFLASDTDNFKDAVEFVISVFESR